MSVIHPIPPVYDVNSRILILGSFPSVKSRETRFYYGHKQNRFWKTLSLVYGKEVGTTVDEKKAFLLEHGLALWDVVCECEISGSSDSSIRSVKENDLSLIFDSCKIDRVVINGSTAFKLYKKYFDGIFPAPVFKAPSTSPANAGITLDGLAKEWKKPLLY